MIARKNCEENRFFISGDHKQIIEDWHYLEKNNPGHVLKFIRSGFTNDQFVRDEFTVEVLLMPLILTSMN